MVYVFKQPWRTSERGDLPFVSHFYRTDAIFNDIDGEIVKLFDDPKEASEFIVRETHTLRAHISVLGMEENTPESRFM